MEMPDFISQFNKLQDKELEQRVWELWLVKYPYMTEENFVSYEDMLAQAKQAETREGEAQSGLYADQVGFF